MWCGFFSSPVIAPAGQLRAHFVQPLQMAGSMTYVVRLRHRHEDGRLLRDPLEEHNFDDFPADYPGGGAGLMATAEDYARFASMLACMGELDGVRILQRESVGCLKEYILSVLI